MMSLNGSMVTDNMARGPRSSSISHRSGTPTTNKPTWTPLVYTRRSPSTNGSDSHGRSSNSSGGSGSHPSSQGEHSPSGGSEPWHEALCQTNSDSEPEISEENMIGDDQRLPIDFNDIGQSIGPTKKMYATKMGKITRNLVPPSIKSWKQVPLPLKEEIWRSLSNAYMVPEYVKAKALKMANMLWKNAKTKLRAMCDDCSSVVEMRKRIPKNLKKEDWDAFVDIVSKGEDKEVRERMKRARSKLKAAHSTGRRGIAQRRHEMEQASPTGKQKVTELNETDEFRGETDLDKDAVAKVLGRDGRGVVRGFGGGVSKTELRASAVSRELLRKEKLKTAVIENRVRNLEETVEELRALSVIPGTNNANNTQTMNVDGQRVQYVVLRNMRKGAVAFRRIDRSADENDDFYFPVLIDEVVIRSEPLCVGEGTLSSVKHGAKILWPKHSVGPWPVMSGRRINPPCKEWFTARKGSPRFIEGVKSFIQFTADSLGEDINQFHCTCMKCQNYNSRPKTLDEIHGDILDHGFDVTYRTWIHHGEKPRENNSTVRASALPTNNVVSEASFPRMVDLFLDTLGRTELGNHENGAIDEDSSNANVEDDSGANVEGGAGASVEDGVDADFRKRMLDALQPLYPDCGGEHTKLSTNY
ncbi:hypothetical protein C5167_040199 [Papaver somniferum]|uniref:Transposase-associated domain-containing protein n=1 Tax=Papaver somniferum TaxID=3469 RepID=A0A4Y7IIF9_PAPSO|nr:hypothetical protein C5167_040199 [Papaver somniferum]